MDNSPTTFPGWVPDDDRQSLEALRLQYGADNIVLKFAEKGLNEGFQMDWEHVKMTIEYVHADGDLSHFGTPMQHCDEFLLSIIPMMITKHDGQRKPLRRERA